MPAPPRLCQVPGLLGSRAFGMNLLYPLHLCWLYVQTLDSIRIFFCKVIAWKHLMRVCYPIGPRQGPCSPALSILSPSASMLGFGGAPRMF